MDALSYSITNLTVKATYHNDSGQVWNFTAGTPAYETWTTAHYAAGAYTITTSEEGGAGNGSCRYSTATPAALVGQRYTVIFRRYVDGTATGDIPIGSTPPTSIGVGGIAPGAIDILSLSNLLAQLLTRSLVTTGTTSPVSAATDWQVYGRYLGTVYYYSAATSLYAWTNGSIWYITSTAPGVTLPSAYFATAASATVVGPYTLQGTATGTPVVVAHGAAILSAFQPDASSAQLQQAIADALKLAPTAGSPAAGSAQTQLNKIGSAVKLSADGLDDIPVTAVTGAATKFPQMVVQVWRRFFKKVTMDGSTLKTYADDDSTSLTEQAASNTSGTQSVGAA